MHIHTYMHTPTHTHTHAHAHTHIHTHTVYTHMQWYIPLLLLSQFWCCKSCSEDHKCLHFRGAWQGWKESLDSTEETKINAELSRFQDVQLLPYLIFDVHISSSFEEQSAYLHMAFLTGHVQSRPATGLYTQWAVITRSTHANTNPPCLWYLDWLYSLIVTELHPCGHAEWPTSGGLSPPNY